jgi:cytoskeletal protein CcmA (bactofilin family)
VSFWKSGSDEQKEGKFTDSSTESSELVKEKSSQQGEKAVEPAAVKSSDALKADKSEKSSITEAGGQGANLEESLKKRFGKLRSALGPGTVIQGKLSFDTPVRIDGKLTGEVFSSTALIVGAEGRIDAKIVVASLIVMGEVKGTIIASEKVELFPGGVLDGDVQTPVLCIQEGSLFNGKCDMRRNDNVVSVRPGENGTAQKPGDAAGHAETQN